MQIIEYDGSRGKINGRELCCALGFFDGVHAGHRHLISECLRVAKENDLTPAVFTFPSETSSLKKNTGRLYTTAQKAEIFESLGVEVLILCSFETVREFSCEKFVRRVLLDDLHCKIAMTGEGFRFGKGAAGDTHALSQLMKNCGALSITVPDLKINGATVSSTEIKEALRRGRVKEAAELLGAPYFINGTVKRGRGVGHTYGFPTLNTDLCDGTILQTGVYKSELRLRGKSYTALTNIGTCPTFDKREVHAETMVLGFDGDMYGKEVQINLIDFIRNERKFDTPEDLKAQIELDVKGLE